MSWATPLANITTAVGPGCVATPGVTASAASLAAHATATDWRALATTAHRARLTLVIYMGVAGVRELQDALLTGLPPDTPVAVVQDASLPGQRFITATLDGLAGAVRAGRIASPAIIVVGEVTRAAADAALGSAASTPPDIVQGRRHAG